MTVLDWKNKRRLASFKLQVCVVLFLAAGAGAPQSVGQSPQRLPLVSQVNRICVSLLITGTRGIPRDWTVAPAPAANPVNRISLLITGTRGIPRDWRVAPAPAANPVNRVSLLIIGTRGIPRDWRVAPAPAANQVNRVVSCW